MINKLVLIKLQHLALHMRYRKNNSQIRWLWKGLKTVNTLYELCFREKAVNFFPKANFIQWSKFL